MQRLPTRSVRPSVMENESEPTALIRLARQIREQQGAEQTRAFFLAMTPFVAPGELKHAAGQFGIELDRPDVQPASQPGNRGGPDPMKLFGALMGMKGGLQGAPDLMKLMELMNRK